MQSGLLFNKNWFNQISIRNKLLLFLAVPILSLLFFIYSSYENERQTLDKTEHVKVYLQLVFLLSDVVTELQKERGLTLGYLQDIDDQQELSLLNVQRKITDEKLQLFKQSLKKTIKTTELTYTKLIKVFDDLLVQRIQLHQLSLNPDNSQSIFKFYIRLNNNLINIMHYFVKLIDDPELNRLITAYMALIQLQEKKGQERGLLNGILKSQQIGSYEFGILSGINSNQVIYLNSFFNSAPIKYTQLLRKKLSQPEVFKVEMIRKDILSTYSRLELLNKIQQSIGYGGLIHQFKNYMVRGEPEYIEQFDQGFVQLQDILKTSYYLNTASVEENNRFKRIISTFDVYQSMIPIISQQHKNNIAPKIIDEMVKVNDAMALDTINQLRSRLTYIDVSNWWQDASFVVEQYSQISQLLEHAIVQRIDLLETQGTQGFYLYLALVLGTIFATLFFAYLLLNRLVGEIRYISSAMASMFKGEYNQRLPINGNDEISQMARAFNQLISERENTEQQLKLALEEAQSGIKAKGDFLSTMSHEIRTPLNGVLGMSELLSQTSLDKEQKEYIETITSSGQLLLTIVNDILDFSKLDTDNVELEQISFDLEKAGFDTLQLLSSNASVKKIDLIFNYDIDIPHYFIGDPSRLRQILLNLVNNAIKFTQSGHVLLEMTAETLGQKLYRIKISVQDSGIGIDPVHLTKLFDAFTQAEQSTTREYGGTGLGLAICKRLVELMGGKLQVTSKPDEGSNFYFTLTLPMSDTRAKILDTHVDLADISILIVDDNPVNLAIFEKYLNHYKIKTVLLEQPGRAMEQIKQSQESGHLFDMILLDHHMPELNGIELARLIRSKHEYDRVKLILLTSGGSRSDTEKIREAGFSAYHTKPVRSEILIQSILNIKCNESPQPGTSLQPEESSQSGKSPQLEESPHQEQSLPLDNSQEAGQNESTSSSNIEKAMTPTSSANLEQKASFSAYVLLAEDNFVNQKVALAVFKKLNLQVDVANNGKEAVERCQNKTYDLIFMDCQMPEMDGYRATAELRKNELDQHTPIIALTANALEEDRQKCLQAGMDDFVSKPFKKSDIIKVLERWLISDADQVEKETKA